MEQNKRTQIAELGEFGLIDKLTGAFAPRNRTTLRGVGDDAAVIAASRSEATLVSTDLLMEGIDFDLTYFPLKHLGYKTVTVGASDILAMNALPEQLLLSLGVSSKFSVEALQEFYEGVRLACEELNIDLAGGDTTASVTGLTVNVTAIGRARRSDIVYRNGAKPNDLICITGNLAPPIWVSSCSNARSASCTTSKIPNRVRRPRIPARKIPETPRPAAT